MNADANWLDRYRFCQPLGVGGMGQVYLAEDRYNSSSKCVVKQLANKDNDPVEQAEAIRLFKREAQILRQLDHSGIVRIFDSYASQDGKYYLVMDYVPGKNLEVMIKTGGPFNSDLAIQLTMQCCDVLDYLHSREPPVIYRDLKPSNLMLTPEGRIVFIDFGIARLFMPRQAATRVVTAGYSPPEQYFGKPETRSDIYSLGATLSHLLTGQRPKPLASSTPALVNSQVLPSLDRLVRRMTAHNPDDRPPTAAAVKYELMMVYKEIYPDYKLPDKPAASAARSPSAAGQGTKISSTPDWAELSAGSNPAGSTDSRTPASGHERQGGLWKRFKQWLEILMS